MDNMHLYTDHVEMALSAKPTHDYRKTNTLHHVVRAVYGTNKKEWRFGRCGVNLRWFHVLSIHQE